MPYCITTATPQGRGLPLALFSLDGLKLMHSPGMYASIAIENARSFRRLKDTTAAIIKRATLLDM